MCTVWPLVAPPEFVMNLNPWSESCVSFAENSMIVKSSPVCVIKLPALPCLTNFAVHAYDSVSDLFLDELLLKDKPWKGRGPPLLPCVQFSLVKKTNTQYMCCTKESPVHQSARGLLNRVK